MPGRSPRGGGGGGCIPGGAAGRRAGWFKVTLERSSSSKKLTLFKLKLTYLYTKVVGWLVVYNQIVYNQIARCNWFWFVWGVPRGRNPVSGRARLRTGPVPFEWPGPEASVPGGRDSRAVNPPFPGAHGAGGGPIRSRKCLARIGRVPPPAPGPTAPASGR